MNCLEFRRLILADPRRLDDDQKAHLVACPACSALTAELAEFDNMVAQTSAVPVPDGLADRVLLRHNLRSHTKRWTWALAASLLIGLSLGWELRKTANVGMDPRQAAVVTPASALGNNHPAVAAISYVIDHEPRLLLENRTGDPVVLKDALSRLGIKLPPEAVVTHLGKCPVPGGTGEHVVLETREGKATLILVPGQSFGPRVVVADRDKAAVVHSSGSGGYILITDSPKKTQAVERLLM
ncbi:MAG: DUF3379 family protein [Burkholderiales bacterium]